MCRLEEWPSSTEFGLQAARQSFREVYEITVWEESWVTMCRELFLSDANRRDYLHGSLKPAIKRGFDELPSDIRNLIRGWAKRATDEAECPDERTFEPFIYGWIAFNGWASQVTEEDAERDFLDILSADQGMDDKFQTLLGTGLRPTAEEFQALWPVFRSKDVGIGSPAGSRDQIVAQYRSTHPDAGFKPGCFFKHRGESEKIPLDWSHTISAIYQVRCNLFHGYKGLHSENDARIVSRAFRVLVGIVPMLIPGLDTHYSRTDHVNGVNSC